MPTPTQLIIRPYQESDAEALHALFYHTVHNVNRRDYTDAQLAAWAPDAVDMLFWRQRMRGIQPYVAVYQNLQVGYADIQTDGYIDHFFCHWQYQGQGVGKALMQHLFAVGTELQVPRFYAHVSKTALPFFQRMGFETVHEQQVTLRGQLLTNYLMERLA